MVAGKRLHPYTVCLMQTPGFTTKTLYEDEPPQPERRVPMHHRSTPHHHHPRHRRPRGRILTMLALLRDWIRKERSRREWKMLILKTLGICFGSGVLLLIILWFSLPDIDDPSALFAAQSTVITDREGIELYRVFSEEDRTYIPISDIGKDIQDATIAIEDERFFDRGCFDAIGFTRAVLSQFIPGFVQSGGSTLTQQFAKNAFVGNYRNPIKDIIRKVRELMLACQLENRYDKQQLLELYLNWIPYGQNAYGIEQASQRYFAKSASGLTLAQSAVLAGLPQLPSYYNPYGAHVRTTVSDDVWDDIASGDITEVDDISDDDIYIGLLGDYIGTGANVLYIGGRTDQVLKNMENLEMITTEERMNALKELETIIFEPSREDIRAPHFVIWIREQVEELLGSGDEGILEQGGFTVKTTLDWKMQQVAEAAVARYRDANRDVYGARNAALFAIDPVTREVLSYVGNTDYEDEKNEGKIDMVRVPRQPGSTFKPFVYALAFDKGYGPATVIYDIETNIGDDAPQNFDGSYEGMMTMRTALAHSRNIPAAKTFLLGGGEDELLSFVDSLGVTTPKAEKQKFLAQDSSFGYGWPLSIGSAETPLMQMVQGYAAFADAGLTKPIVSILQITDRQGNIVYAAKEEPAKQVLDAGVAAQIVSVLSDAEARPANEYWRSVLTIPGYQAGAKTGTSNKCLERREGSEAVCSLRRPESTWTLGFTPNIVAGVWVGNATSESLSQSAESLTTAAPIWRDFMNGAHKTIKSPKTAFALPSNVVQAQVSRLSGELPSECTPVALRGSDLFLSDRIPTKEDPACLTLEIDKVTELLASDACPAEAVEERSFFLPTSEAPLRWPLWEQSVQEWAKKQMEIWNASETHTGSQLPLPIPPTEECDPLLTPGRDETPVIGILFPNDGGTVSYPAFEPRIRISSLAEISEVRFEVDGKPIRTVTSAPFNVSVRVPRSIKESGTHTLTVTVMNEYFSEASESVQFRFGEESQRVNTDAADEDPATMEEIDDSEEATVLRRELRE